MTLDAIVNPPNIPRLTTAEMWQAYVDTHVELDSYFRPDPETFLITRLEDIGGLMKLPTLPYRRAVHEIVFVTTGRITRSCDLTSVDILTGEIHLLMADQIGTVEMISPGTTGYYCHFSLETIIRLYHKEHMVSELLSLSSKMKNGSVKLDGKAFIAVKNLFDRLREEYLTTNNLSLIDAYLVTLCYEIKNSIEHPGKVIRQQSKSVQITENFKQLILRHIHHQQSLSFYADHLGISPNHLNKAVKKTTGRQASALIADMLVLEAKVLLKHSELSVSEIAFKLGFHDHSYFSRFFRKETGWTPSGYRSLD